MPSPVGTATEVAAHTQSSPIGSVQRHYHLNPPLASAAGSSRGVVVVPGANATYAFTATETGEIADFTALVTHASGSGGGHAVLAALGYRIKESAAAA